MKKLCASLLFFCIQTSLIISCDSGIEIPNIHHQIHIDDHMATTAALISATTPLDLDRDTRMLHYTAIGILSAKLVTEEDKCFIFTKTSKKFSPFIFSEASPENTFCMFLSSNTTPNVILAETDKALAQTARIPSIATFTTHIREYCDHDTIRTTHHESDTTCKIVIPHFDTASPKICITTTPKTREEFTYNIKDADTLASILPPFPSYPGYNILLLAAKHPTTHDNATKIVKIWALPPE